MNMTNERIQTKSKHTSPPGLLALVLMTMFIAAFPRPADAACSNPTGIKADIVYNSSQKLFEYCNDTNWVRMNPRAGSGTGGCTNPAMDEGKMVYNADHRVMQGCAGNVWRALGAFNTVFSGSQAWQVLASRWDYSCGIKQDGSLWCWGGNGNGQIGNNSTVIQNTPLHIQTSQTWKHVAVGRWHTCAIRSDNTLWCWGGNGAGRTGLNTSTGNTLNPTQVSGGGSWKTLSLGHDHSCGIKADDTLWCWGTNASGRTGLNTTAGSTLVPTQVSGGGSWKSVSLGYWTSCAIKSDDTLHCWGSNQYGGTGMNTTAGNTIVPTGISGGGTWKHIAVGLNNGSTSYACAIKSDDTAHCWGANSYGNLGDGTTTQRLVPTAISGGGSWRLIEAGSTHTCGIKSDSTGWCWGYNSENQLNDGTTTQRTSPTAVIFGGTWKSLHTGFASTCGIRSDNQIYCWGSNTNSIMGFANTSTLSYPVEIAGGGVWKAVSVGGGSSCGIKSDDTLWCWGQNTSGQLGDNTTTNRWNVTAVSGGGTWKSISMGAGYACGIKSDDTAWCWGSNYAGATGQNTTTGTTLVPTQITGGGSWKALQASGDDIRPHTCGIKSDDTLWCWGMNIDGRTGLNTTVGNTLLPTQVTGGGTWKSLSVAGIQFYGFTCAIKSDDTLWCWGDNDIMGQLGDGTFVDKLVPTQVSGGGAWKQVGGSGIIACAVKTDNSAWCWGTGFYNVPTAVTGGGSWKMWSGKYGIKTDQSAYSWDFMTAPTAITGGVVWDSISTTQSHQCGLTNTGSLLCWGSNNYGQLTETNVSSPYISTPLQPDCGSPAGKPGAIVYNSSENFLQYCMGGGWAAFGGYGAGSNPGPTDLCAGSPNPGDVCADGTVYAGLTPDGNVAMYTTRCDAGQTWDGSSCINARQTMPWNNGQADWVDAPIAECGSFASCGVSGKTNTPLLATSDSDSNDPGTQPHDAAKYCDDLVLHGQSDWYLPSIAELVLIHGNKVSIGQFDTTVSSFYASSSENAPTSNAWSQNFNNGTYGALPKDIDFFVRCARQ